jgi:hypothetical protein
MAGRLIEWIISSRCSASWSMPRFRDRRVRHTKTDVAEVNEDQKKGNDSRVSLEGTLRPGPAVFASVRKVASRK